MKALIAMALLLACGANASATTFRQLTSDNGELPSWSRDGTNRVSYDTGSNVYFMDAAGGPRVEVTHDGAGTFAHTPSWGPANNLTYKSYGLGGQIVCPGEAAGDTSAVLMGSVTQFYEGTQFSPDGSTFAFSYPGGASHIYVCPAVPGGWAQRQPIESIGGISISPSWSPDGRWIAFRSNQVSPQAIYIVPSDGSAAPIRLTYFAGAPANKPDWSPNGQWIAFDFQDRIRVVPSAGGTPILINTGHSATEPSFSPDGTSLAYNGPGGIWIAEDLGLPDLPTGACCDEGGLCVVANEVTCLGDWIGYGSTCSPNPCPQPTGACCSPDGFCAVTLQSECTDPSEWQGVLSNCTPNPCPQPTGACCFNGGTCIMTPEVECMAPNTWQGMDVPCSPELCIYVGVADEQELATTLSIRATPNPFRERTDLAFTGPKGTGATLLVVDASGRRVYTAWWGVLAGRRMMLHWDGRDDSGREVSAGVYLARLQGGTRSAVVRLVKAW